MFTAKTNNHNKSKGNEMMMTTTDGKGIVAGKQLEMQVKRNHDWCATMIPCIRVPRNK